MTVQGQATWPEAVGLGEFTAAWRAWHEARLADPHGFLAVTSLHWLTETPRRFADAPGACTDLATCPLPENRLPVAIEVGAGGSAGRVHAPVGDVAPVAGGGGAG